jgi:hypothetical protein
MYPYIYIIAIILSVFFLSTTLTIYKESLYILSDADSKEYLIRSGTKKTDSYLKSSANTLAEINKRVEKLIEHLDKIYSTDLDKRHFITKLKENYNSNMLSEAAIDKRYTTYTIDKKEMHICLRTRDEYEKLYDINLLMYVVLHELAHVCNYDEDGYPIQGHGNEFKYIFKFLLLEAIKTGIYEYIDYSENPEPYCGIILSTSILSRMQYEMFVNGNRN